MAVVLVVEDDLAVAQVLCRHLERRGHTSLHAANASQALTIGANSRPDAAILDLRLPDGDGLAVFTELRLQHPMMVGVMLTGFGSIANSVASMRSGMADYLEKPTDLDQVIARIEDLLASLAPRTQSGRAFVGFAPAVRVARAAAAAIDSQEPPRTLAEWGRAIGAARGTLRTWCQSAGVHPHDALSLTRGLWAVRNATRLGAPPAELLGYVDARSTREFLTRSGELDAAGQVVTPVTYCRQQQFCRHTVIVAELISLLSSRANPTA